MRALTLLALIFGLLLSGCATQFETDRDRVVILTFGFGVALVSNKTTRAKTETTNEGSEEAPAKDEGGR